MICISLLKKKSVKKVTKKRQTEKFTMFKNQGELLVEELECHIFCFFSMRIEKKITRKIIVALQTLDKVI